jgi:hypothetical protein
MVLLHDVEIFRSNDEFAGREAVLLMDNWSVYMMDQTLYQLADQGVKEITYLPHITEVF